MLLPSTMRRVNWSHHDQNPMCSQGQGFMADASMNRAGNVKDIAARLMVMVPHRRESFRVPSGSEALSLVLRGMDPIFAAPDAEISRECGECGL